MKIEFKSPDPEIEGLSILFATVVHWGFLLLVAKFTILSVMGLIVGAVIAYLLMCNLLTALMASNLIGKRPNQQTPDNPAKAAE
jgi:hypothetical protein